MRIAYNQIMDIYIKADDYKDSRLKDCILCCPYCNERVEYIRGLAENRDPYFRHQHGTYRRDCELYAESESNYNKCSIKRLKRLGNSAVLYFRDTGHLINFNIGITLSEELLTRCAEKKETVSIITNENEKSIPIDERNFVARREKLISLSDDSEFVSVTFGEFKWKISYLPKDKVALFYVRDNAEFDEGGLLAKRVEKGEKVYYGEKYIFVYLQNLYVGEFIKKSKESIIFGKYKVVYGEFRTDSSSAETFCNRNEYRLCDEKEKITVLWPPIRKDGENNVSNNEELYALTNFELEKEANINVLAKKESGFWIIPLNDNVKIAQGCVFESFYFAEADTLHNEELICVQKNILRATIEKDTYLFSSYGVSLLDADTQCLLLGNRCLKRYQSNYCVEEICNCSKRPKYNDWIRPILQYNRKMEDFFIDSIQYTGNNPYVWEYLIECRKSKKINSIIKMRLVEGRND